MRSYSELNRRVNPFWEEVMALLADDQNQTEDAERNQVDVRFVSLNFYVKQCNFNYFLIEFSYQFQLVYYQKQNSFFYLN